MGAYAKVNNIKNNNKTTIIMASMATGKTPLTRFIAFLFMSKSQQAQQHEQSRFGNGNFHNHLRHKRVNGKWKVSK